MQTKMTGKIGLWDQTVKGVVSPRPKPSSRPAAQGGRLRRPKSLSPETTRNRTDCAHRGWSGCRRCFEVQNEGNGRPPSPLESLCSSRRF